MLELNCADEQRRLLGRGIAPLLGHLLGGEVEAVSGVLGVGDGQQGCEASLGSAVAEPNEHRCFVSSRWESR